jgi:hypothetical protein
MSDNTNPDSFAATTSIVHRESGGITGLREVTDDASRLTVCAFPFAAIKQIVAFKTFDVPACYLLAGSEIVYIGESGYVGRRLLEHRDDSSKQFASQVFVVSACDQGWLDKVPAIYLQYRLTNLAEAAGLVRVQRGAPPRLPDLPKWRHAPLKTLGDDARRLLFDAGCHAFDSAKVVQRVAKVTAPVPLEATAMNEGCADPADAGVMEIGVTTVPHGVEEYELSYGDIVWARGYHAGDRFVVAAGSDVPTAVNPSARPIVHSRRKELTAAGALIPIARVGDRMRLAVAVAFPSQAIAAAVICGAHVDSSKWTPLRFAHPLIMAI